MKCATSELHFSTQFFFQIPRLSDILVSPSDFVSLLELKINKKTMEFSFKFTPSLSLSLCLFVSHSVSLSLFLSLSLSRSLSLSLSLSHTLSLLLTLSLTLSASLSPSLPLPLSFSLPLPLSFSLPPSPPLSPSPPSLSLSLLCPIHSCQCVRHPAGPSWRRSKHHLPSDFRNLRDVETVPEQRRFENSPDYVPLGWDFNQGVSKVRERRPLKNVTSEKFRISILNYGLLIS